MAVIPLAAAESVLRSSGGCARPAMLDQAVGWNLSAGESVKIS